MIQHYSGAHTEVQYTLIFTHYFPAQAAIQKVNEAVSAQDMAALLAALRLEALGLLGVREANGHCYLEHFTTYCQHKAKVQSLNLLMFSLNSTAVIYS